MSAKVKRVGRSELRGSNYVIKPINPSSNLNSALKNKTTLNSSELDKLVNLKVVTKSTRGSVKVAKSVKPTEKPKATFVKSKSVKVESDNDDKNKNINVAEVVNKNPVEFCLNSSEIKIDGLEMYSKPRTISNVERSEIIDDKIKDTNMIMSKRYPSHEDNPFKNIKGLLEIDQYIAIFKYYRKMQRFFQEYINVNDYLLKFFEDLDCEFRSNMNDDQFFQEYNEYRKLTSEIFYLEMWYISIIRPKTIDMKWELEQIFKLKMGHSTECIVTFRKTLKSLDRPLLVYRPLAKHLIDLGLDKAMVNTYL